MLEKLRRNPDAVALTVLCLLLGVAKFSNGAVAAHLPLVIGVHRVWTGPAPTLEHLRQQLENLRLCDGATPSLHF